MRVRASTGRIQGYPEVGAALCKRERVGERGGEAAVARRRRCTQRQGTGMLVHEYVHVQHACVHVCKRVAHTYLSLYNAYHTDMLQYYVCVCVCRYTHTEAFWHMRMQNQMYRTWMKYA